MIQCTDDREVTAVSLCAGVYFKMRDYQTLHYTRDSIAYTTTTIKIEAEIVAVCLSTVV